MNKKYIMLGIACLFLVVSGICYSVAFRKADSGMILSDSAENKTEEAAASGLSNSGEQEEADLQPEQVPVTESAERLKASENEKKIYVHICGAVVNPGVYEAEAGARISELIKMSGGLCEDAAGDYINQARQVTDGERIYIPAKEEVKELTVSQYVTGDQDMPAETKDTPGLVNINTADAKELMNLPGIGQAKADSIIDYRTTNGSFRSIEELMNISGIKEGLYNRISSYITVK